MAFSSWRGVVGMINPTMRPGVTEEVIRLLPEGIGLIPLFLNVRRGTQDEFRTMMPAYEKLVAALAGCGEQNALCAWIDFRRFGKELCTLHAGHPLIG